MDCFLEKANTWLDNAAGKGGELFTVCQSYDRSGRLFPLAEFMTIRDHHPILSFRTKKGRWGVSSERCYFDICETITEENLGQYFQLLTQIQKTEVDCSNPEHDYTFLSLVVLTASLSDARLIRQIKRFRSEKTYDWSQREFGWSSCRFCVIDLATGKFYPSAMADPLKARLS